MKPAVDEAAKQVHPITQDVTKGVIRPGGEQLSKNAVPVTKDIAENKVQPAVDQVSLIKDGLTGPLLVSSKWLSAAGYTSTESACWQV